MIGILDIQGDGREHAAMLSKIDIACLCVRAIEDLRKVDALIIPGGESTVIGDLLVHSGLDKEIVRRVREGMPLWGTCAGAILLATDIESSTQPRLGLWEMTIARNAYGRQIASFEADIEIKSIGSFPAVFIRAPVIEKCSGEILATHDGTPVLVRNKNLLVSTFHPELTDDPRLHEYFVRMIEESI